MTSTVFCITGMVRSGTSLIANAVNQAGVYFGREAAMMPAQAGFNDDGFFEHMQLVEFNYRLLESLERNEWFSTRPLPDGWWRTAAMLPVKEKLRTLLTAEFAGRPVWGWKDPRAAILLPLWIDVLRDLGADIRIITPFRNPLDVAVSVARTWNLPRDQVLRLWLRNLLAIRESTPGLPHLLLNYDDFLENPEAGAACLQAFLGPVARPDLAAVVRGLVRPGLRHSKASLDDLAAVASPDVTRLYRDCLGLAGDAIPAPLIATLADYRRFAPLADFWRCDRPAAWQESMVAGDFGHGIDDPDGHVVRLLPHTPDGRFDMTYPLPRGGARQLVFHPCGERLARCRIEAVETDGGAPVRPGRCNASGQDAGWDLFASNNIPTYELAGDFSRATVVRIRGQLEIFILSDHPVDQQWQRILSSLTPAKAAPKPHPA
jgi:hypothetical protein